MLLKTLETFLTIRVNGPNAAVWNPLPYVREWVKENHRLSDEDSDRDPTLLTEKERRDAQSLKSHFNEEITAKMSEDVQLEWKRILSTINLF